MKRILTAGILILLFTSFSSCMTLFSVNQWKHQDHGGAVIFSGTRLDIFFAKMIHSTSKRSKQDRWGYIFLAIDFPFSLIADTLLLPVSIPIKVFQLNSFSPRVKAALRGDINGMDSLGRTALFVESGLGRIKSVRILLENGANIDIQNQAGLTPLMNAAMSGKGKIVRLLLENQANPHLKNKNGSTAEDMAEANGHHDIVKMIEVR